MAIYFDAPITPVDLTMFVRRVPVPADNQLMPLFPDKYTDTNRVDIAELNKTNRTARFRAFDGRIHTTERDGEEQRTINLLPLSDSLNKGEYERIAQEFIRTQGQNRSLLADAIYNDAETLTNNVYNRLEQAWGDVLTDGKLTINENGFQGEADFGLASSHKVVASVAWSNPSALALTEYRAWCDVYWADNGFFPARARVSVPVGRALQRNQEMIAAAAGTYTGRTQVSLGEINQQLASEGLPIIEIAQNKRVDIDGTITPTIGDDMVLFLPQDIGMLGYTQWGVTATALELVSSQEADFTWRDAKGIVGVIEKDGPPYREFTFVDAIAMPILALPRLLLSARVL